MENANDVRMNVFMKNQPLFHCTKPGCYVHLREAGMLLAERIITYHLTGKGLSTRGLGVRSTYCGSREHCYLHMLQGPQLTTATEQIKVAQNCTALVAKPGNPHSK